MSELYKSDTATAGIWRGLFVSVNESTRSCQVYIPQLHKKLMPFVDPANPKGGVISDLSNYPTAYFACPGVFYTPEVGDTCWVMFEMGDVNFPVVVGQIGTSLPEGDVLTALYGGGGGSEGDGYITEGGTDWITKWTCTVYGNTPADDNGVCGWNSLRFREANSTTLTIQGCHVAIPMNCITSGPDSNFPEFSEGYGTVLEVRNPKNGKTCVAVVADCGNFGPNGKYNHDTALDLAPRTQQALDIHDTQPIEYRKIGHISSWNGEQLDIKDFPAATSSAGGSAGIEAAIAAWESAANGKPYGRPSPQRFDCSSSTCYAYIKGGLLTGDWDSLSTYDCIDVFKSCGWVDITSQVGTSSYDKLVRGDMLWAQHHMCIYLGNGQVTKSNSDHGNYKGSWYGFATRIFRYGGNQK